MRNPTSRLLPVFAAAALLAPAFAFGQPLTENFDSVAGLGAAGWVQVNNGNPTGTTGWFQGNPAVFSAQGGSADSYAAANFNGATFGGNVSTWLLTPTAPEPPERLGAVVLHARGDVRARRGQARGAPEHERLEHERRRHGRERRRLHDAAPRP